MKKTGQDNKRNILRSGQGSAYDAVNAIAPGYAIGTSPYARFFNRILLHPIRELRMQKMGTAIKKAIQARVGKGTTYKQKMIETASSALSEAMGKLKGKYMTPQKWEHELRKATSEFMTKDLLGPDWRSFQRKTKYMSDGKKKKIPSVVERKLPLVAFSEASKQGLLFDETEARLQLDLISARLSPSERNLFNELRKDSSRKKAAKALGISASTARNQFASIKKKFRSA